MADEAGVRATFSWIATALIVLNVPVTVADLVQHPEVYRPWFAWTTVALMAGLASAAVVRLARGLSARWPLGLAVASGCVGLALHPLTMTGPSPYPPLLHVLGAAMSIAGLVSVRWSFAVIGLFSTGVVLLRAPALGVGQAVGEGVLLALGGLVGTACVAVFSRAGASVHDAVEQAWLLAEQRARLAERAAAREHWDGLVHDSVLGALSLASRSPDGGVPPAAGELARQALDALRGTGEAPDPLQARWAAHGERLGLQVAVRVHGGLTAPRVREAFAGAVSEALTNVSRHSGTTSATVSGFVSDAQARVLVVDRGVGFDPAVDRGIGIRTSIVGRMRAVGGTAEVLSAPGGGTQVVLGWRPPSVEASGHATRWQLGSFAPMIALAWGVLAAVVVVSWPTWTTASHRWLSEVVVVTIAALTAGAVSARPSRVTGAALAAAMAVVAAVGSANTPPGASIDWRYWYLSALNPALAALSYRFSRWTGVWALALVTTPVLVLDMVAGRPGWSALTEAMPVLVGTVVAAQLIRLALADAWETVEETTRQGAELRLALAAELERESEALGRVAELDAMLGPTLDALATGDPLAPQERAGLDLLAAAVRDRLAAPGLVDPGLVDRLRAARQRGVLVDVVTDRGPGGSDAGCALCRQVLGEVLGAAPAGARIRVTWSADPSATTVVTVVGPALERVATAVRGLAEGEPQCRLTLDEDALLIELSRL